MSILFKGMDMPKNCEECRFLELDGAFEDDEWVSVESCMFGEKLNCPLVEIPTPHGRLIDEDDLIGELTELQDLNLEFIAPTIIEAEE